MDLLAATRAAIFATRQWHIYSPRLSQRSRRRHIVSVGRINRIGRENDARPGEPAEEKRVNCKTGAHKAPMEELAPSGEAKMHTPREALPGVDQQDQYDRQADERF